MKNSLKFLLLSFLLLTCSDNDESISNSESSNQSFTSITLSTPSVEINTGTQVSFSVLSDTNIDLTSESSFNIDGSLVSNPYTFNQEGSFELVANYEGLTSNVLTISVQDIPASSITLSFDQESYVNGDFGTYVVRNNFNSDITSQAVVSVNGTAVSTNPYQFSSDGNYVFSATFEGLSSATVEFDVDSPSSSSDTSSFSEGTSPTQFTKKVLLEDFTGTWCPQCPPAAAAVSSAVGNNSNIFGVGYHASGGDPMEISQTSYWSGYYNVTGFPTVYVNGPDTRWNYSNMSQVNDELAETATIGLAVSATNLGGKLDIEVQVGFMSTPSEEVKLMIYLVEGEVTSSTAQAGSSQGTSYVHKDVLREVFTDRLGDVIPASSVAQGGVFTRTITGLDFPSNIDNLDDLKVIVFLRNTYAKTFVDYFNTTHTNSPHYDIYNVQEVNVGEVQAFD